MRTIVGRLLGTAVLALAAGAGAPAQTPPVPSVMDRQAPIVQELFITQAFEQRVSDYVALHRLLEGPLPPIQPGRHMDEIRASMQLLAGRIQRARAGARQGDLITPDAGRMFRRRIATCLSPEDWDAILAELAEDEEGVPLPQVALQANTAWPGEAPFGFVPPQLLQVLPPLPPELQYRIIGRSLVLWDHHANLVVDYLPGAFTT